MGQVWTLDDWNDIIQRVNDLAQNPDPGCDPVDPLEEVEAPHIWKVQDVEDVRDKLMEICDENEFEAELEYWKQDIIDEIEEAIDNGWCNCEKCQAEDITDVIFSYGNSACPEIRPWDCNETDPCVPPEGGHYDWWTASAGITGFGKGIGGGYQVVRQYYKDEEPISAWFLYSHTFDCAGNQDQPRPEPERDNEGHPIGGVYADQIICFACARLVCSGFWIWWNCGTCVVGLPTCCAPPYPSCFGQGSPCPCPVDEGYIHACYPSPPYDWGCHSYRSDWQIRKYCDAGFHGEGQPCRKCCSDGIRFCDDGECPGDPACEGGNGGGGGG
jgi:hypothetical protein